MELAVSRLASHTAHPMMVTILAVPLFLLSAPLARAGTYSATAIVGPTGITCSTYGGIAGGSGFVSASIGPVPCSYEDQLGRTQSSSTSAAGSWITGDFSASGTAAANPVGGSINAISKDDFSVNGNITLPSGMNSASVTFGVTGVIGTVNGLGVPGFYSSGDMIELDMSAGGSSGTSGKSVACLTLNLFWSPCPGGTGIGFGPGALTPVTLTVHNGDTLQLHVLVESTASVNAISSNTSADAGIIVDPVYLTLSDGATFDSSITGFLSGDSAPEPASVLLIGAGLLGLWVLRRRRHSFRG